MVDGAIIAHPPANVTGPTPTAETRTQPQSAQPHPPARLPKQVQCGGSQLIREAHSWTGRGPGPMGRATAKRSRSLEGRQPSGLMVIEREGLRYVYKSFENCGDRAPPSGWTLDTRCLHLPPAPVPVVGVGPHQSSVGRSLCSWAWGPQQVLSQPCPGAEPMAASSPSRGPSPWGRGQCSVISFHLTAGHFSAVQPGQCGAVPCQLGPPCALLPTCCRAAAVAGKPAPPSQALRPGRRDGVLPGEQWAAVSCLQGSRQGHPVSLSTHPGGLALPLCPLRLCVCVYLSVCPGSSRQQALLGSCPFPHGLWGCESTPLALRALAPVLLRQGWQQGALMSLGEAGLPGPRDRHPHRRVLSLA